MTKREIPEAFYDALDRYRATAENAAEEYGQALDDFEETWGKEARDAYEEKHV